MDSVHDLGDGVYFAREDYAGFLRRLVIISLDLLVILLAGVVIVLLWNVASTPGGDMAPVFFWFTFGYLYLTLLRGSRFRTLGYILTGVRIVNLKGNRPSFLWMNLRLFLWTFGPFNPIVDMIWFWGDENRQMLRDKFTGNYVIRKDAVPIGKGPIQANTLFILGCAVVYPEVKRAAQAA